MQSTRFEISACADADVGRLERELGVSAPIAQVLVRRGFGEPAGARAFLAADDQHPPAAFAGIGEAVESILAYVRSGERITIHGDYDVDGMCSTAVLMRLLRRMGANVDSYLPDRADGYGLKEATVRRLAARGTRLLLTVDCAITAVEEVAAARALGMDVVVTDHHSPRADGVLPRAPIVHPLLCGYPCPELCATAVAYKLAQALALSGGGREERELAADLDLVALATIADVVPLVGENRTLVRRGLRALQSTTKPGLRALMMVARVDPGKVDERSVGFALAPRLNAAGRIYRADAGLELLLTEAPERAREIAEELDRANGERRRVERHIRFEAEAQIAAGGERSCYVLAAEGWHAGVIGIVASRLVDRQRRPVVMISLDGDTGKGSGRSIEAFDLLGGLSACAEHLRGYGGHRAAAGLEIERGRVEDFATALCAHAERVLDVNDMVDVERVDAVVGGDELGMTLAEELQQLAPFGRGNPGVSLLVADATFRDGRPMGDGKHVRFTVESRGAPVPARWRSGPAGACRSRTAPPRRQRSRSRSTSGRASAEPRLVLRRARPAPSPHGEEPLAPQPAPEQAGDELVLFAL